MASHNPPSLYSCEYTDEHSPTLMYAMQLDYLNPNDFGNYLSPEWYSLPLETTPSESASPVVFTPSTNSDIASSRSLAISLSEETAGPLARPLTDRSTSSTSSQSPLSCSRNTAGIAETQSPFWNTLESGAASDKASPALSEPLDRNPGKKRTHRKSDTQVSRSTVPERPRGQQRRARGSARRHNAISDADPKVRTESDFDGNIRGIFCTFGHKQNVRAAFSSSEQAATKLTRKIGACGRCRTHRQRCDASKLPWEPCKRCANLPLDRPFCIRVNLPDISLHRKGSTLNDSLHTWTMRKGGNLEDQFLELNGYPDARQKIKLTQEMGNTLEVDIARFDVEPDDTTAYHWEDSSGQKRKSELPPYYICDMEAARHNMRTYGFRSSEAYIKYIIGRSNPIILKTFETAYNYAAAFKSDLVVETLRFWSATRLTERTWHITFDNPLGLKPFYDQDNPWNGTIPVTPIMDTQLDELAIGALLNPLRERILFKLKAKIAESRRENWFEIYLTCFILLCNTEFILSDVIDYSERHSIKTSSNKGPSLSEGYFHACKTILAYFHYACTGSAPFRLHPLKIDSCTNLMTQEQQDYIRDVNAEVSRQERELEQWPQKSMYRSEMYFCYQLLCKDWRGDIPHAAEIFDYTEQDFLTS